MTTRMAATFLGVERELANALVDALALGRVSPDPDATAGWKFGYGWDGHFTATDPDGRERLVRVIIDLPEIPHG